MTEFPTALNEVINRSFQGKKAELARAVDMDVSVISKLCSSKMDPSTDRLDKLCGPLTPFDRRQLLIAASRDKVPERFQDEIFGEKNSASDLLRSNLSPDLAKVISYFEQSAMRDESTASFLRHMGKMSGVLTREEIDQAPILQAADEEADASSKRKGKDKRRTHDEA